MNKNRKRNTVSGKAGRVKGIRRICSRRMKFCVQRSLGVLPSTSITCQFYQKFLSETGAENRYSTTRLSDFFLSHKLFA